MHWTQRGLLVLGIFAMRAVSMRTSTTLTSSTSDGQSGVQVLRLSITLRYLPFLDERPRLADLGTTRSAQFASRTVILPTDRSRNSSQDCGHRFLQEQKRMKEMHAAGRARSNSVAKTSSTRSLVRFLYRRTTRTATEGDQEYLTLGQSSCTCGSPISRIAHAQDTVQRVFLAPRWNARWRGGPRQGQR